MIYDLVVTAREQPDRLEAFVTALVPVYFGRVASAVIENRELTTERAEESVERQAREFERLKPYLVDRWNREPRRRERHPLPLPGSSSRSRTPPPRRSSSGSAPTCSTRAAASSPPWASSRCRRACRCPRARRAPGTPAGSSSACSTSCPRGRAIHPIVRIGRHAAEGIVEAAAELEADLIVFGWGGKSPGRARGR